MQIKKIFIKTNKQQGGGGGGGGGGRNKFREEEGWKYS